MTSRYLIDIENRKSKIIHVYRNGDKYSRAALVLLRPIEQQQLERIFRAIEEKLTLPHNKPIRRIFSMEGKEIEDPIFVKDQNYYVVGSAENFINIRYGCIYKWTMIGPVRWSKFSGVFYEPPEHDDMLVQQKALYQWKSSNMNRLPSKMTKSMSAYPTERKVKNNSKLMIKTKRPVSEPSSDTKVANQKRKDENGFFQSPVSRHSSGDASEASPKIISNQNKRSMDQFLNDSLKMINSQDQNDLEVNQEINRDEIKIDDSEQHTNEDIENLGDSNIKTDEDFNDKSEDSSSNIISKTEKIENDDIQNEENENKEYLQVQLDSIKPYASAENVNYQENDWKPYEYVENKDYVEDPSEDVKTDFEESMNAGDKADEDDGKEISETEEINSTNNQNKDSDNEDGNPEIEETEVLEKEYENDPIETKDENSENQEENEEENLNIEIKIEENKDEDVDSERESPVDDNSQTHVTDIIEVNQSKQDDSDKNDETCSDIVQDSLNIMKDSEIVDQTENFLIDDEKNISDEDSQQEKLESGKEDLHDSTPENQEEENDTTDNIIFNSSGDVREEVVSTKEELTEKDSLNVDSEMDKENSEDETESMIPTGKDELKFKEKETDNDSDIESKSYQEERKSSNYSNEVENCDDIEAKEENNDLLGKDERDLGNIDEHIEEEDEEDEQDTGDQHDNKISTEDSEAGNTEDNKSEIENEIEENVNNGHIDSQTNHTDQYNRINEKSGDPEQSIIFETIYEKDPGFNYNHAIDIEEPTPNLHEQDDAAKIIQKNYRGHLVRRELISASNDLDNDDSEGEQNRSYDIHDSEDDDNDPDVNLTFTKDATNDLVSNEILDEHSQIDNNSSDDIFASNIKS